MGNSTEFKNSKVSGTGRTGRFIIVMVALVLLLFFALVLNINTGSVYISPAEIVRLLSEGLNEASTESVILFRIRLPRMLLAAVLGGALSVSGYLLQVFFRNPIAGPFVLGISSGAKMLVGFTLISYYGFTGGLSSLSLIVAAFAGSLIITGVVLLFAQKVRNMSMLLVIGIM
ncbi:MAG: iron chelate uptake ABC transporter family permease subunit, partial [Firmicutes bacterium]|nr:iron chelate uptake ABC transporter family permease subunit [Bacillota bacterium]